MRELIGPTRWVSAAIAAIALAAAIVGQAVGRLLGWERIRALGAAALIIVRGFHVQAVGVLVCVALVTWSDRRRSLTAVAPSVG